MAKQAILAAIQHAASELGRAPSRGELKRITGVSHYRVLREFRTLREAIQAAGLKPNPKGKRITTDALLRDWKRVKKKLGRNPSRSEYTREGKYSAGALTLRFGSWSNVGKGRRSGDPVIGRSGDRKNGAASPKPKPRSLRVQRSARPKVRRSPDQQITRSPDLPDKSIAMQWASSLTQIPAELAGKRRVTEAFAMLIVNTLLGENSNWHLAPRQARFTTESNGDLPQSSQRDAEEDHFQECCHSGALLSGLADRQETGGANNGDASQNDFPTLRPSASSAVNCLSEGEGTKNANGTNSGDPSAIGFSALRPSASSAVNGFAVALRPDRPIMGPPFNLSPLANAPINELGVVFLFGVMAGELGFQVDALQARDFPDCEARRQVEPGKWQRQRIEFEYESKNFALHGHDPAHCDVIVCWRHNWKECPEGLEVIELGRILGRK